MRSTLDSYRPILELAQLRLQSEGVHVEDLGLLEDFALTAIVCWLRRQGMYNLLKIRYVDNYVLVVNSDDADYSANSVISSTLAWLREQGSTYRTLNPHESEKKAMRNAAMAYSKVGCPIITASFKAEGCEILASFCIPFSVDMTYAH